MPALSTVASTFHGAKRSGANPDLQLQVAGKGLKTFMGILADKTGAPPLDSGKGGDTVLLVITAARIRRKYSGA